MIKRKNFKKYLKYGLPALLLLFLIGGLSVIVVNSLMNRVIHSRQEVIVPDITGMPMEKALTELSEFNLSLMKVSEKFDSDIPAGSIITQSPPPGFMVKEGKPIEAVISTGGKTVFVPELEGMSLRQVELILRQTGLGIGEHTRTYSNSVREEHIVSQFPYPGEILDENSYVDIVVSRGPAEEKEIKELPDLVGRRLEDAEKIIKEMGMHIVNIEVEIDSERAEGTVIEQKPEPGQRIDEDTEIILIISQREREQRIVREEIIYYEVVQSGHTKEIKIEIEDDLSERVVYEEENISGGERLEVPVKVLGDTEVRIFEDGVLRKEETLEEKEEELKDSEIMDISDELREEMDEDFHDILQQEEELNIEQMWGDDE